MAIINGTELSEFIDGTDNADVIDSKGGNDTVYGHDGDDEIKGIKYVDINAMSEGEYLRYVPGLGEVKNFFGNSGNDTISGAYSGGNAYGGSGNDKIIASSGYHLFAHEDTLSPYQDFSNLHNSLLSMYGDDGNDFLKNGKYMDGGHGDDEIINDGLQISDIYGREGDDVILAWGKIFGGSGNDIIKSRSYSYTVITGNAEDAEDDVIYTNKVINFNNQIYGEDGDDTITGSGGNDEIFGGSGNDTIHGDEGDDYIKGYDPDAQRPDGIALWGENEKNDLYGGGGNDTLDNGAAAGFLYGGSGNDTLIGFSRSDDGYYEDPNKYIPPISSSTASMFGELGDDTLLDGLFMDGGQNNDTIKNSGLLSSTAYGGEGKDTIDVIGVAYGGNEDDYITSHLFIYDHYFSDDPPVTYAFGGGSFFGENGNDTIDVSGFGRWRSISALELNGGDGDDTLTGAGEDIYYGGKGNDIITNKTVRFVKNASVDDGSILEHEYTNDAQVYAGEGNDTINASGQVYGEDGDDYIFGSSGFLYGGDGEDTIEVEGRKAAYESDDITQAIAYGGKGNDTLRDLGGNHNILNGDEGNDKLYASTLGSTLNGGDGDDELYSNLGTEYGDTFSGGDGNDIFILRSFETVTTITDFSPDDKIDLTALGISIAEAFLNGDLRFEQDNLDTLLIFGHGNSFARIADQTLAILLNTQADLFGLSNFVLPTSTNNIAPDAKDDNFAMFEDTILSGNLLLDHGFGVDSDANGDTLHVTAQTITSTKGGTVILYENGDFSFKPKADFYGTDTFKYTLTDGQGGSDVARAVIQISDVADNYRGDEGDNHYVGGYMNDLIKGAGGNDVLFGGNGWDRLEGNDGNDTLYGGFGSDIMKGGKGADLFVLDGINYNRPDTIEDLRINKGDTIQIKDILTFDPLHDAITDFIHITQNGTDSILSVDVDGTANGANFEAAAKILGITGLDVNQLYNDGDLIISNVMVV